MTDHMIWVNDIDNRFSPSSLTDDTTGSIITASAIISGVTTKSGDHMSLEDAYKDLRERLLDGDDTLLPESTTTQRDALDPVKPSVRIYNITTKRMEICNADGDWISSAGEESNTSIITWTSKDSSGIQAGKTYAVQPWSSLAGLLETTELSSGSQIVMPFDGTAKNLYIHVDTDAGSGESHTFTIQKNGNDQSLAFALDDISGFNTTDSFTFNAGQLLSLKVVGSSGCDDSGEFSASIIIVFD